MSKQSYQVIRDQLFTRLRKASGKKVAYNHKVSTHIGAGGVTLDAFLNVLNDLPVFKADRVFLAPGKVKKNPNVEELLAVVFDDYKQRGWTIYYE